MRVIKKNLCYNFSMGKKILIIGNSAKEYALAKKLSEENEVFVVPQSDSVKEFATCLDIREDSVAELLEFVLENEIDITIPVSLKALSTNIVEIFNNNNQQIFAPSLDSAKLVFDKALAKKVLYKLRIPTPKFGIFEKQNMAMDYIKNLKNPFVIKTNESSSAVVLNSINTAKIIVDSIFVGKTQKIIIEDYVWGTPFAFYAITDGYKALPIGSSIMYKHSLEGDGGQLTCGMGACSPNYKLSIQNEYYLMDNVIYPLLDFLEIEGNPYTGIIGVNGILIEDGNLQILGFQSFMQDCDCAAVLEILDTDLLSLMQACIIGSFSDEVDFIPQKDRSAVSVTLTCKNKYGKENPILGLDSLDDDSIVSFYPSVKKNKYLEFEAEHGHVLNLTSTANTSSAAVNKVYNNIENVKFEGISYRKDICKIPYSII